MLLALLATLAQDLPAADPVPFAPEAEEATASGASETWIAWEVPGPHSHPRLPGATILRQRIDGGPPERVDSGTGYRVLDVGDDGTVLYFGWVSDTQLVRVDPHGVKREFHAHEVGAGLEHVEFERVWCEGVVLRHEVGGAPGYRWVPFAAGHFGEHVELTDEDPAHQAGYVRFQRFDDDLAWVTSGGDLVVHDTATGARTERALPEGEWQLDEIHGGVAFLHLGSRVCFVRIADGHALELEAPQVVSKAHPDGIFLRWHLWDPVTGTAFRTNVGYPSPLRFHRHGERYLVTRGSRHGGAKPLWLPLVAGAPAYPEAEVSAEVKALLSRLR